MSLSRALDRVPDRSPRRLLIVGGSRRARVWTRDVVVANLRVAALVHVDAAELPFVEPAVLRVGRRKALVVDDLERAFPDHQHTGTRLVLTEPTYLIGQLLHAASPGGALVMTADAGALAAAAPDALNGRGPWKRLKVLTLPGRSATRPRASNVAPQNALVTAFNSRDPRFRLARCRQATRVDPASALAWLCLASAARENQEMALAHEAFTRALALTPDWDALHYEAGKFWLAVEDLERARRSFHRAAALSPRFAAASINLAAVLGELGRSREALNVLEQSRRYAPDSAPLLGNLGVTLRERGRLAESAAVLRRACRVAPGFVFAHYNLAHTLLLSGRYSSAIQEYEAGLRLDAARNRRQQCRLAIARMARRADPAAERTFWMLVEGTAAAERMDLLRDAAGLIVALGQLGAGRQMGELATRVSAALGGRRGRRLKGGRPHST